MLRSEARPRGFSPGCETVSRTDESDFQVAVHYNEGWCNIIRICVQYIWGPFYVALIKNYSNSSNTHKDETLSVKRIKADPDGRLRV